MARLATQELTDDDLLIIDAVEAVADTTSRVAALLGECSALLQLRSDYLRELTEGSSVINLSPSRTAITLDHGLYFVTHGALCCHVGRLSFPIVRGELTGTHNVLEALRGITPTFTREGFVELLHVPTAMAKRFARHWSNFEQSLADGPLLTHLMDAAWHLAPSARAATSPMV